MTLNGTLAIAGRSLEVFGAGIQVAGQNIANANTPGYIREQLLLEASPSFWRGTLTFGTGVGVVGIRQQIDQFLETRIHAANTDYQASRAREAVFKKLEAEIAELGEHDLSTSLNNFLAAIHETVNQPESASMRQFAVHQGERLAADVAMLRLRVDQLREAQSATVEGLAAEANALIDEIARLNPQIAKLEANAFFKSDAGALRTQRYNALNRLAEIMPIRYTEHPDGSIDLYTGTDFLIMGGTVQHLEPVPDVDRGVPVHHVRLSRTGSPLSGPGGELRGAIEGRDAILGGFVDQLDAFAANLIFEFNRIHSSGEGLAGFASVTATTAVDDATAALNEAGLPFTPRHGSFQVKVTNPSTGLTETTDVGGGRGRGGPGGF
jgi:flagellar hook-associated protein 1